MVEGDHLVEINKKNAICMKTYSNIRKGLQKSNTVKPKMGEKLEFWKEYFIDKIIKIHSHILI